MTTNDKNIYDKITNIFTKQGFRYSGAERAYDLLTEARASLERSYGNEEDWSGTHTFVNDLVKVISELVKVVEDKPKYAIVSGQFDESGNDKCGPEEIHVLLFKESEESLARSCYGLDLVGLGNDLHSDEKFESTHTLMQLRDARCGTDEIRCGRTKNGLHTGFATIVELKDER